MNDPAQSWQLFHKTVVQLYESCFPEKCIQICYENKNVWMSDNLKKKAKIKNALYYKYKKVPSTKNKEIYDNYYYYIKKFQLCL